MPRSLSKGSQLLCLPGKIVSWLILPLALTVVLSVIAARAGWSILLDWDGDIPILGAALTVNSLVDFQWYAFALIVLFGGIWAYIDNRHVTVDFIAVNLTARSRAWVRLFGDIFLLLPLCAVVVWYGTSFAAVSWQTGEGSNQGGLVAHWLIKGAIPVSFALLALAGLLRIAATVRAMRRGDFAKDQANDG